MTEEYSHALSWEAATERFAAAGSVSVAEAEAMDKALKSAEAGIDVRINVYLAHFDSVFAWFLILPSNWYLLLYPPDISTSINNKWKATETAFEDIQKD